MTTQREIIPAPLPILFGLKPEWEAALHRSADVARFAVEMADLRTADLSGYAAIVPLNLPDHEVLERADLPALPVPRSIRQLCHDKVNLNRRLIDLGFGDHVPRMPDQIPQDLSSNPVILKPRRGAWGRGAALLQAGAKLEVAEAALIEGTHFLQDLVPGRIEYAAHVLVHRGMPCFWQVNEYDMGDKPVVKGIDGKPRASRWLPNVPGQDTLTAILRAIGFDQGTCCVDYRIVDGRVRLFEINPRFGGSLAWHVMPYLEAYLGCLDGRGL